MKGRFVANPTSDDISTPPAAAAQTTQLRRTLTLPQAVALAVTIVVGSGALILPGIAYQSVGSGALWAWLLAAAAVIPLLAIFARLGATYPTAGGVAGFVQAAFGRPVAGGVEILFMGTFGLGIPAIALTGGHYLAGLGLYPHTHAWVGALAMLALATGLNLGGVQLSARVQTVLAITLAAGLLLVGIGGLIPSGATVRMPELSLSAVMVGLSAVGLVFFAFTGWEMLAFTTEEYRNPKRDFPLAVGISFVLVTGIYVVLALAVQSRLGSADSRLATAPVQAVVDDAFSVNWGRMVAFLGAAIIMANLIGAIWGASRLVMSSAREGLLPAQVAGISARTGAPTTAVVGCAAAFTLVVITSSLGWLPLDRLLSLAGQNFFLLYLLSVAAYVKLFRQLRQRLFGLVVCVALSGVALFFGVWSLLYALVLFSVGMALVMRRSNTAT
jgi:amino acid efflux transporter